MLSDPLLSTTSLFYMTSGLPLQFRGLERERERESELEREREREREGEGEGEGGRESGREICRMK